MLQSNGLKGRISAKERITAKLNNKEVQVYPELEDLVVTPSVEEQHFKSNKYGYDNVTVEAVDSSIDENIKPENIKEGTNILGIDGQYRGIDTSNATATADDVLKGKTSYSQNEEIIGTIETYDGSYEGNVGENIKITDASYLFYNGARTDYLNKLLPLCENVKSCDSMFYNCNKLTDLDLSKFDTSQVTNMQAMFHSCGSLTSLDVSNFNTSKVTITYNMFYGCRSLTDLDVSNFDTSNLESCGGMFGSCNSLTSLDLSNFDISKVKTITYMFYNCTKLVDFKFGINLGKSFTQKINNYPNYKLDLSYSKLLTHDSLMSVINNLYDLNLTYGVYDEEGNDLGGTLYRQSLVLGTTNLAKLTDEEIAIATNKGWNVS